MANPERLTDKIRVLVQSLTLFFYFSGQVERMSLTMAIGHVLGGNWPWIGHGLAIDWLLLAMNWPSGGEKEQFGGSAILSLSSREFVALMLRVHGVG